MGKKVLIVDDEEAILRLVTVRLKSSGYEVITAYDGVEGLQAAAEHRPDLIILDILMPNMDGTEMSAKLKEDPRTRDIPVIFLTALKKKEGEPEAKGSTPNVIFSKPFEGSELVDAVGKMIQDK